MEVKAAALKAEGTALFAQQEFAAAAAKYIEALQLLQPAEEEADDWAQFNPNIGGNEAAEAVLAGAAAQAKERRGALLLTCALNASLCLAKQAEPDWRRSATHASAALALAPCSAKALFRRGVARLQLGELQGARKDLLAARAAEGGGGRDVRQALGALKVALAAERARADDSAAAMAAGFGQLGGGDAGSSRDDSASPVQPPAAPSLPRTAATTASAGAATDEAGAVVRGLDDAASAAAAVDRGVRQEEEGTLEHEKQEEGGGVPAGGGFASRLSLEALAAHDKSAGSISVEEAIALGVPQSMIMGVSAEMAEEARRRDGSAMLE